MMMQNFTQNEEDIYSNSGQTLSEINVTPLVDVMLVLLIIFMVTAPLMHHGVNIDLPKATTTAMVTNENSFILVITKNKELFINKHQLSIENLSEKITAIFEEKQDKDIFIQSDQNVSYGFVIEVMAALKQAGINRIGLVTIPKDSQK